ncbi:hypothetical protein Dimus_029118 [Dionaea muscipula]
MHGAATRGCRCWSAMVAAVRCCLLVSIVVADDGRRLRFTLQELGDAPSATASSASCASEEHRTGQAVRWSPNVVGLPRWWCSTTVTAVLLIAMNCSWMVAAVSSMDGG